MISSENYTYRYGMVFSILTTLCFLVIMGKWNRYIFVNANLIFLFLILVGFAVMFGLYKVPKSLIFSNITFSAIVFIVYMCSRTGSNEVPSDIAVYSDRRSDGLLDVMLQLVYYGLFSVSALLYYKKGFSTTVWLIIVAYLLAFIGRNSTPYQWDLLKIGYNVSPGYCVFSLAPFLFLKDFRTKTRMRFVPHIIFIFCTLWVLAVRARGPGASLLIFYACIFAWPLISRRRLIFSGIFPTVLILIITAVCAYIFSMTKGQGLEHINEISMKVFQKRIGTRYEIWNELWAYISNRFWFGYGTESASRSFAAGPSWIGLREGLNSHSTYFELMLRFGVTGLILYLVILFNIWKAFWYGRKEWAVRVAGSYLIASLFFMTTGPYLIFETLLENGFAWIVFGIGIGGCLKAKKHRLCNRLAPLDRSQS